MNLSRLRKRIDALERAILRNTEKLKKESNQRLFLVFMGKEYFEQLEGISLLVAPKQYERWLSRTLSPWLDNNGHREIVSIFGVAKDFTLRRHCKINDHCLNPADIERKLPDGAPRFPGVI
jgi:hypothetical protein